MVDLSFIIKAQQKFEEFRQDMHTERDKAGAIQAFEFCFELSWKIMRRLLALKGVNVNSPRDAIRQAYNNRLIHDGEQWFIFLSKRNLIMHTYNKNNMDDIVNSFEAFSYALKELIWRCQNELNEDKWGERELDN